MLMENWLGSKKIVEEYRDEKNMTEKDGNKEAEVESNVQKLADVYGGTRERNREREQHEKNEGEK